MLLLVSEGLLHGITSLTALLLFSCFGVYFIVKSLKTNVKLLFYLSLMLVVTGFFYLRLSIDFITIILTGVNANFPNTVYFFIGFIWAPLSGGIGLIISTSLVIPKQKWYFIITYLILLLSLFSIVLLDVKGNVHTFYPSIPGEELIENQVVIGSPASILIFIMAIFTLGFGTFGTFIKGINSRGIIRKKLFSLSIAWFLTHIFVFLEGFVEPGLSVYYKFGNMVSFTFFYFGLREEPEKIQEISPQVEIEDGLFRIRRRPAHITEDEVSISKEKKICLICKNQVSGYNIFICPSCDTFYCQNCAHSLEDQENVCWVCNKPINNSKPSKPYEFKPLLDKGKKRKKKI